MRRGRRQYDADDYFNFLYDLAFESDDYIHLARVLHEISYEWYNRLDENRMWDGMDIRKYYLCDELGYLPEDIDTEDEYIFPKNVSVLEMFVGFSNKLCKTMLPSGWRISDLVEIFCKNLDILDEPEGNEKIIKRRVKKWGNGEGAFSLFFGEKKWGNGDLWSEASDWIWENVDS